MLFVIIVARTENIITYRTVDELFELRTFLERFDYLKLNGRVGVSTFGFDRYLNQRFYSSLEWKQVRDIVMLRDEGCDLGCSDHPIIGHIIIHHMNPVTAEDFSNWNHAVVDPQFLISTSQRTHQAIHYGDESLLPKKFKPRFGGDTKLW